ncbi:unnamed protein product [Gongylonema pulchrum]|uniref:Uncharacterized protein n=1 Tax=Gongylonema pulchrum TaxID=637853 RepID=A0A183DFU0_9BILA|nr:unnamed protein product [Gongylonema pulchrum]
MPHMFLELPGVETEVAEIEAAEGATTAGEGVVAEAAEQQPGADQMAIRVLELRSRAINIPVPAVEEAERNDELLAFSLLNLVFLPRHFRGTLRGPGSDPYRILVVGYGQCQIGTFADNSNEHFNRISHMLEMTRKQGCTCMMISMLSLQNAAYQDAATEGSAR